MAVFIKGTSATTFPWFWFGPSIVGVGILLGKAGDILSLALVWPKPWVLLCRSLITYRSKAFHQVLLSMAAIA